MDLFEDKKGLGDEGLFDNDEEENAKSDNDDEELGDWEDFDDEKIEDEEEKKQIEKEKQEKKKLLLELKKSGVLENEKIAELLLNSGSNSNKNITTIDDIKSGMFKKYAKKKSDFETSCDLFGGVESIHIELLEPKTEKDFDDFSKIVSEKIKTFGASKFYKTLVTSLFEKITQPLSGMDTKKIVTDLSTFANSKLKEEKLKKKEKLTNVKIDKEIINDDPFSNFGGAGESGKYDDDDDDFM